jgi:UrcA family protein
MNPRLTFSYASAALLAFAATGLATKADTAIAQQVTEEMEEIVIEGPVVRRLVGGPASVGAKTEVVELERRVSYADLDLSKKEDLAELETRIETTAKETCEKLSDMFPADQWDRHQIQRCTKQVVGNTEEQVLAAVAAAG